MGTISKLSNDIQSLLIELFKTTLNIAHAHASEDVLGEAIKNLKGYSLRDFGSLISNTNQSVSTFVSFFEDYIKAIKESFDFLSELLKILGVKNIGGVFLRKVDLRSTVKPSEIDIDLLKFQLKTALEYLFPKVLELASSVFEKSKKLPDSAKSIESEVIENFKNSFENTNKQGLDFTRALYSTSELIFKEEDPSRCVNLLIQIIESAIDLAQKLWQSTKFTPLFTKDWIKYDMNEITETAEKFSEIKMKIDILTKCREKTYEHEMNVFMIILRALWGSEEIVIEKVGRIMQTLLQERNQAVDAGELLPPKFLSRIYHSH